MTGKSYGYMIFDDDNWSIALDEKTAIKYIQNRLLESPWRKKMVQESIIDEGYPKTIFSDDFMKDFIRDMLKDDPYYFDTLYYVKVPLIEN